VNKIKRRAPFFIIAGLLIFIFTLAYSLSQIHKDVKVACLKAKALYAQDCVDSLIKFVQSDENSYRLRNTAIWALGQIADKKSLPYLQELNQSLPEQTKCSYDNYLCKYEAQKAIKWCEQGNLTSWMYGNKEKW
jgi:HEAT repeat protein